MFLEIRQLEKKYDRDNGVSDIDLSIERGEFVTLLGPSGCGKTTILNLLGGFLRPDRGSILLEGEDITALPPEARPVSTVFQSYALFPHMNVLQNVSYGLRVQKMPRAEANSRAVQILETVGLKEYHRRAISQLSGGQQQRVALARALVMNPKVLLLDDPLSNLDAKLRVKMRDELKEIQAKFGITMVFVTHDQEEALSISDRIVVLDRGNIRQIGTPEAIYATPADEFVADFIGRVNVLTLDGVKRAVRPEHLIFVDALPASESDTTLFRGTIVGSRFLGAYRTYLVALDPGALQPSNSAEILQVDVPIRQDRPRKKGDAVRIAIDH
ncbi:MAG: ABC transporter ATP-binding protein [Bacillota bacterium]|nr:ABC transporter ATP-binding protein [Bacillota bacterium]